MDALYERRIRMKRIVQIQVNGQVQWQVGRSSAGRWIGVCQPLGLTMEGDSLDDLFNNINESVQLLMEDLVETGEFDSFLRHRGWQAVPNGSQQQGPVEFQVPIDLLVRTSRDSARTLLQ